MDEVHRQMQPFYKKYLHADRGLLSNKSRCGVSFIEETARRDEKFIDFAMSDSLSDIAEDWSECLREMDSDSGYFMRLIKILLDGGYNTNWQQLATTLKSNIQEIEVYGNYQMGEAMAFLHGVAMLMSTSWDDTKKMEYFDVLYDNWDFLKHIYSFMIRRVIGCKLNFISVANLVAQKSEYHQFIHLFYCVVCYRQDSLKLTKRQLKGLEDKMVRITNIMDETKPSDALNDLLDTLFPEDFQRMLDEFRPETREQIEKDRNRLRDEVGILTGQLDEMAQKLKNALERSVPIDYIEEQLLCLPPGTALDLCGELATLLSGNSAWMMNMPRIVDKIKEKQAKKEKQMIEVIQMMAEKKGVEVKIEKGGLAQITESGITNQMHNLLESRL